MCAVLYVCTARRLVSTIVAGQVTHNTWPRSSQSSTHTHCIPAIIPGFSRVVPFRGPIPGGSPDICRNGFEDGVLPSFKIVSVRACGGSECFSDPANGNHFFFLLLFRSNPSSHILKDRLRTNGITRDRWAAASLPVY